jgi:hypothetical protein
MDVCTNSDWPDDGLLTPTFSTCLCAPGGEEKMMDSVLPLGPSSHNQNPILYFKLRQKYEWSQLPTVFISKKRLLSFTEQGPYYVVYFPQERKANGCVFTTVSADKLEPRPSVLISLKSAPKAL